MLLTAYHLVDVVLAEALYVHKVHHPQTLSTASVLKA